jgi:hypothetical protein
MLTLDTRPSKAGVIKLVKDEQPSLFCRSNIDDDKVFIILTLDGSTY